MPFLRPIVSGAVLSCALSVPAVAAGPYGDGSVAVSDHPMQWHPVTLTLDGPAAAETDTDPNPFTGYRFGVVFTHESGTPSYVVPGYFAADGDAANTSAKEGNAWRAHLSPDTPGTWTYTTEFHRLDDAGRAARTLAPFHGVTGSFTVAPTDKSPTPAAGSHIIDFRGKGRLTYVGGHHLRFAGDGTAFLKIGADAPETLFAYTDFDDTFTRRDWVPVRDYTPHKPDWNPGDPTWQNGKGKGLIGALNYLSAAGGNGISFIPYNLAGDGRNVWPMVSPDLKHKLHYDCSKLDQWRIVLEHAQARGLHVNFKLQETENDDDTLPDYEQNPPPTVPASLDGGDLGPQRKLYLREMIARFGHLLAVTWNLGEENSQTPPQQRDMANFILDTDPYDHLIVVQTFPHEQDKVYRPLLGSRSVLTGAALQNDWDRSHPQTLLWVRESDAAGRPWVVCNDEQNHWTTGVPPDSNYPPYDGLRKDGSPVGYDEHDVRQHTLWGNLMAGGGGVEYYFGWELPQGDLFTDDWRSRAESWRFGRLAVDFFRDHAPAFPDLTNRNDLVGNYTDANGLYCLAPRNPAPRNPAPRNPAPRNPAPQNLAATLPYVVYVADARVPVRLNLAEASGSAYTVRWFNPRDGGPLALGSVAEVPAGRVSHLGEPPADPDQDWAVLVTPVSEP
ncbi:MAG: DUF5060 domain-containing protein [Planctomycetota bacterium]